MYHNFLIFCFLLHCLYCIIILYLHDMNHSPWSVSIMLHVVHHYHTVPIHLISSFTICISSNLASRLWITVLHLQLSCFMSSSTIMLYLFTLFPHPQFVSHQILLLVSKSQFFICNCHASCHLPLSFCTYSPYFLTHNMYLIKPCFSSLNHNSSFITIVLHVIHHSHVVLVQLTVTMLHHHNLLKIGVTFLFKSYIVSMVHIYKTLTSFENIWPRLEISNHLRTKSDCIMDKI